MPFNIDPQRIAAMRQAYGQRRGMPTMSTMPAPMPQRTMAKGGSVSGASRGDGCVRKGHTKGKVV